jgi:hypothetical protein
MMQRVMAYLAMYRHVIYARGPSAQAAAHVAAHAAAQVHKRRAHTPCVSL